MEFTPRRTSASGFTLVENADRIGDLWCSCWRWWCPFLFAEALPNRYAKTHSAMFRSAVSITTWTATSSPAPSRAGGTGLGALTISRKTSRGTTVL